MQTPHAAQRTLRTPSGAPLRVDSMRVQGGNVVIELAVALRPRQVTTPPAQRPAVVAQRPVPAAGQRRQTRELG